MAGMTEPNDGSGVSPAWTARVANASWGVSVAHVASASSRSVAGDQALGVALVGDQQRLRVAGEQLDGLADRILAGHRRERRLHHLGDLGVEQRRVRRRRA